MPEMKNSHYISLEEEKNAREDYIRNLKIKECKKDTITFLIDFELGMLRDEIWYEVKQWDGLWRILHDHSKEFNKPIISSSQLEDIKIHPGDRIIFTKNYVYIIYKNGEKEIIPFNNTNCQIPKEEKVKTPEPQKIKVENKDPLPPQWKKQDTPKQKSPETKNISFQMIFDKNSPFIWDKIAYENELQIKKQYGKLIEDLEKKYCKNSIITKELLYGLIAQESRFDINGKSRTWVEGLGQITVPTAQTLVNINLAKLRKIQRLEEIEKKKKNWKLSAEEEEEFKNLKNISKEKGLYITHEITLSKTQNKTGHYPIDSQKLLKAENQIKLTLWYLLYLEESFQHIKSPLLKKQMILTAYNFGPGATQNILQKYRGGIKDWKDFHFALLKEVKSGNVSKQKYQEVKVYAQKILEYANT